MAHLRFYRNFNEVLDEYMRVVGETPIAVTHKRLCNELAYVDAYTVRKEIQLQQLKQELEAHPPTYLTMLAPAVDRMIALIGEQRVASSTTAAEANELRKTLDTACSFFNMQQYYDEEKTNSFVSDPHTQQKAYDARKADQNSLFDRVMEIKLKEGCLRDVFHQVKVLTNPDQETKTRVWCVSLAWSSHDTVKDTLISKLQEKRSGMPGQWRNWKVNDSIHVLMTNRTVNGQTYDGPFCETGVWVAARVIIRFLDDAAIIVSIPDWTTEDKYTQLKVLYQDAHRLRSAKPKRGGGQGGV